MPAVHTAAVSTTNTAVASLVNTATVPSVTRATVSANPTAHSAAVSTANTAVASPADTAAVPSGTWATVSASPTAHSRAQVATVSITSADRRSLICSTKGKMQDVSEALSHYRISVGPKSAAARPSKLSQFWKRRVRMTQQLISGQIKCRTQPMRRNQINLARMPPLRTWQAMVKNLL